MIELLPRSSGANVGFKLEGKVTAQDYDVLQPKIDEAIGNHERINLLVVLSDFDGWGGVEAMRADFSFGKEQYRQVHKAAFAGQKEWQKWMVKLIDPFTRRTEE